jgi:hypothetical protein
MSFDISRLRRADRIIGIGAIALFIFMFFFKWYGVSSNVSGFAGVNVSVSKSGWDVFTNSRWIWLLTIIVALGSVALVASQRKLELPVQPGVVVAGLGALSTVFILYRIIHHPTASASFGGFHASVGIKIGIWLGLIAAAIITYGGYLAMQDEGTSLADVREQASGAASGAFSGLLAAKDSAGGGSQGTVEQTAAVVPPPGAPPPIPPPASASGAEPAGDPPQS